MVEEVLLRVYRDVICSGLDDLSGLQGCYSSFCSRVFEDKKEHNCREGIEKKHVGNEEGVPLEAQYELS